MTLFEIRCRLIPHMRRRRPDATFNARRAVVERFLRDWRGNVRHDW